MTRGGWVLHQCRMVCAVQHTSHADQQQEYHNSTTREHQCGSLQGSGVACPCVSTCRVNPYQSPHRFTSLVMRFQPWFRNFSALARARKRVVGLVGRQLSAPSNTLLQGYLRDGCVHCGCMQAGCLQLITGSSDQPLLLLQWHHQPPCSSLVGDLLTSRQ